MDQRNENKVYCAYNKLVKTDEIKLSPRNSNLHSPEQIDLIAHSLIKKGWRRPVLVGTFTGKVVAGEGRVRAAQKLGIKEIPVDYQKFESERDEYEYLELDNNTTKYSQFDKEKFISNVDDLGLDLTDIEFKDFGLYKLDEIDKNEITEEPPVSIIDEKEINEDTLPLNNKVCPECGYEW